MRIRNVLGPLAAVTMLVTGCATQAPTREASGISAASQPSAGGQMSMSQGDMTGGTTSPVASGNGSAQVAGDPSLTPSATAQMICGPDIRSKVMQALTLSSLPSPRSSFSGQVYTCSYALPMGPIMLAVAQSSSKAGAGAYFDRLRSSFGKTETLMGLGERSYGTDNGIVVVVKDDKTLTVDTTKLPPVFGDQGQKRTDLAYELASDVLGCWTGGD
jgi:hypothetical protein